jgi:uncharacterized protein YqhQ
LVSGFGRQIQKLTTKEPPDEILSVGQRGMAALLTRERNA